MKKLEVTLENPNGILVDLTAEEIAQKETDEANALVEKQELEQAQTNEANKKASGKQKLLDLGLSEEEVKAIIGI
jgi:predicted SPOUT superfamily RNA methylase MTH1